MSDDVQWILADPKATDDFVQQIITSRRQDENAVISVKLGEKTYQFQRMGRKSGTDRTNG